MHVSLEQLNLSTIIILLRSLHRLSREEREVEDIVVEDDAVMCAVVL